MDPPLSSNTDHAHYNYVILYELLQSTNYYLSTRSQSSKQSSTEQMLGGRPKYSLRWDAT